MQDIYIYLHFKKDNKTIEVLTLPMPIKMKKKDFLLCQTLSISDYVLLTLLVVCPGHLISSSKGLTEMALATKCAFSLPVP